MTYKIPLSWVESVKRHLDYYVSKWLGVSKNISNASIYSDQTSCPLPIHCLITEFKKHKVSGLLQLQLVRDNVSELHTGKKWEFAVEATNIDSRIKMLKFMGNMWIGRTGQG